MTPRDLLVIMAKEPAPGRVKTRFSPPLSPEDAARLYRSFLEDTIDLVRRVPGVAGGIACDPPGALPFFAKLAPGFNLLPQPPGDLGRRLGGLFELLLARGAGRVCLMNSDGPDLPAGYLRDAFRKLDEGADVIFGPNTDGGYYLVGLSRPADIFRDIPWSTGDVLAASIRRAERADLRVSLLPSWPDLDTPADLRAALDRWRAGETPPPPRTFRLLDGLFANGAIP